MSTIRNARIVLGVTGGIAAYKAADLASKLVQHGAQVHTILTESGSRFVGAPTFEAITHQPVHLSVFESWREDWHGHISLGQLADLLVVAPATADRIARLAHGFADDMLGAAVLASGCPLIVAPAMEHAMYHHQATMTNLEALRSRGTVQVGPEQGRLASGESGDGRMSEPLQIIGAIRQVLGRKGPLAGKRVVVTAGGTRENLDPIRFVGNRSSGLMGYAMAQSLIDNGAEVVLISGPSCLQPPYGAEFVPVTSALNMQSAVGDTVKFADALIMAAAVSDYRPRIVFPSKLKKDKTGDSMNIELVANPDVVAGVEHCHLIKVGFAAETENLAENARRKLKNKSLDMIVANEAEATIGSPTSQATLLYASGEEEALEVMPKSDLADLLVERLTVLLNHRDT